MGSVGSISIAIMATRIGCLVRILASTVSYPRLPRLNLLHDTNTLSTELDLPEYDSYEALRHQLYTAMTAGSEYFGFA